MRGPALLLVAGCVAGCQLGGPAPTSTLLPSPAPISACRPGDPLAGVWSPDRLRVLRPCQEARGAVLAALREIDGDSHLWLRPDPGYEGLLNRVNRYQGQVALVLEIVPRCEGNPADEAAAARCPPSPLPVPRVGDHIQVFGPWVLDTTHGWNEIHPVIQVILLS